MTKLNPKAALFVPRTQRVPYIVALVGPPGSGKTVLGQQICQHYGYDMISISDNSINSITALDDKLEEFKAHGKSGGIVLEFIRTSESAVVVSEICKRHGLKVSCTLFLEMDDIEELILRLKQRPDLQDQSNYNLLSRIHEFMFAEQGILKHYESDAAFFKVNVNGSLPSVLLAALNTLERHRQQQPLESLPFAVADDSHWKRKAPTAVEFISELPFMKFVGSKQETLQTLRKMQQFIGMYSGNLHTFPGMIPTPLDEKYFKVVCASLNKYLICKRAGGHRFLLLFLRGEEGRGQCYLIDSQLALYKSAIVPDLDERVGEMLLDGNLCNVRGRGYFVAKDVLYLDGKSVMAEKIENRVQYINERFPVESRIRDYLNISRSQYTVVIVSKIYYSAKESQRVLAEVESSNADNNTYTSNGLIFTPVNSSYKPCHVNTVFEWRMTPASSLPRTFISPIGTQYVVSSPSPNPVAQIVPITVLPNPVMQTVMPSVIPMQNSVMPNTVLLYVQTPPRQDTWIATPPREFVVAPSPTHIEVSTPPRNAYPASCATPSPPSRIEVSTPQRKVEPARIAVSTSKAEQNRSDLSLNRTAASPPTTPQVVGPRKNYKDLCSSIKRWLIKKFTPPASMAYPRPFAVFEIFCGNGSEIAKWEEHRAAHYVGLEPNADLLPECHNQFNALSTTMTCHVLAGEPRAGSELPESVSPREFDVISCLTGFEQCCKNRDAIRSFFEYCKAHLKKGGNVLLCLVDFEQISKFAGKAKGEAQADRDLIFQCTVDEAEDVEWSHFTLKTEEVTYEGFLAKPEHIIEEAQAAGLAYAEYGHLNFQEVASYLKGKHKTSWQELSDEHREYVKLFTTLILQLPV